MVATPLTIQTPPGNYPTSVSAGTANYSFDTADPGSGNSFVCTGKEVLIVKNTHVSDAKTVTITSVLDPYNRSGDITTYSLDSGDTVAFGPFTTIGWKNTDGLVTLSGESTDIKFAVDKMP